jgi:fructose-1,6-bisphosphatase II
MQDLLKAFQHATEAGALAATDFIGKGDKEAGDKAAVDALRLALNAIDFQGTVIIGEGEKDKAPMLFNGEKVGTGNGPKLDIAVDPVEGTALLAADLPNAICVMGLAPQGTLWEPGASFFMQKIIVGKKAKHAIDINKSTAENLAAVALALDKPITALRVFVLDKPRHEQLKAEINAAGAQATLYAEGDVLGGLRAALPNTDIDIMMGVGGTPEGVLTACAIKALGGGFIGKRAPQFKSELALLSAENANLEEVLTLDDLVKGPIAYFSATGITSGDLLKGVVKNGDTPVFDSFVLSTESQA